MRRVVRMLRVGVSFGVGAMLSACGLVGPLPDGVRYEDSLTYASRDSGPLGGHLFLPDGPGPHPAVLLIHGGGWSGGAPWHMDHIGRMLAAQGFVAFSMEYRFAPDHVWPAQLVDARDAWHWLAARPDVSADDMTVWGYSAGAHLALMLGLAPEAAGGDANAPRPVAIVGGGSPTRLDLFDHDSKLVSALLGGTFEDRPDAWRAASPIGWASADDPPVYLYHGTDDTLVPIEQAEQLANALRRVNVPVVLDAVSGGHVPVAVLNRDVESRATAFIRQQLHDTEHVFDADLKHTGGPR